MRYPIHPDASEALKPMEPLFKWIGPRYPKSLLLYSLARSATGPIIELGTYHGQGTIPLALGARDGNNASVFTVDPFVVADGWIGGEKYGPEDLDIFHRNLDALDLRDNVTLIRMKSEFAYEWWQGGTLLKHNYPKLEPVGEPYDLLFWDIGGQRLINDYMDWCTLCAPGGLFVMKDTPDWKFGSQYVFEHALRNGFTRAFANDDAMMWGIRRQ